MPTILLAEDDVILSQMYMDRLQEEGYTVLHAQNGEIALNLIAESIPDLMILDIMMPKLNGLDVLKSVREDPKTKHIPVIIVTALVQEIEKIRTMMNQADAYVIKSEVLPGDFMILVKKTLDNATTSH